MDSILCERNVRKEKGKYEKVDRFTDPNEIDSMNMAFVSDDKDIYILVYTTAN